MILLPAVDIRDGKAVRLRQGHFDDETVYADDPLEAARSFVEAGARFLHVVDLDGAREGEPANLHHVERITAELDVPVELGGGLRSIASIRRALTAGARARGARHGRVHRPGPARRGARRRSPRASWSGWTCAAGRCRWPAGRARPRCAARTRSGGMQQRGVTRFVYTNVDRDGMLEGPDLDEVRRVVGGRARALPLLGRHRLARGPARAARAAAREPRRRDLRQGALRGPLRRRARARRSLGRADAAAAGDPVPRRGQGPRGQGRRVREPARRRRPGRAGRALPGRGRRRDRLPRHHRLAREARDRGRAGPPLRRRRVHPVHDRRRRALGRGRPGGARRRAPTRCR